MQGFPVWNIVKSFFYQLFSRNLLISHIWIPLYTFLMPVVVNEKNLTSYFHFSEKPVFSYFTLLVSDTD